jgi:hypothetical protein
LSAAAASMIHQDLSHRTGSDTDIMLAVLEAQS